MSFLKNLNLGMKLNLLMFALLAALVIGSGGILSVVMSKNADEVAADLVANKAVALIETMSAVRQYTGTEVRPELADDLETSQNFIAQTVPGYSARQVFEYLRARDSGFADYSYKEATLNPTNPRDRADEFEAETVNRFRADPKLQEQRGFGTRDGTEFFYIARPLAVSKASCLECHRTPEVAPPSLVRTYGTEGGFGWNLDEIAGAQTITVPSDQVLGWADRLRWTAISVLIALFALATLILNASLRYAVIRPLKAMAHLSRQVTSAIARASSSTAATTKSASSLLRSTA